MLEYPNSYCLLQWEEAEPIARFLSAPYEWWMEGEGRVEQGSFIGVVRTENLDTDSTVYSIKHSYNSDGKNTICVWISWISRFSCKILI